MAMTEAIHVIVTGRVQGVGFRDWTRRAARQLSLKGWVRNRDDGTVEAHVEGDRDSLDRLSEMLKNGPPAASVADVTVTRTDPEGAVDFGIR